MTTDKYRVLILGHGEIGRAVEHLLAPRHALRIWERKQSVPLEEAGADADFVAFCLPTAPHFELAARLRRHLPPRAVCFSVAKGLDDRGRNAAQVLQDSLPESATGVLCGPMIAEEIRRDRPAFAQFASEHAGAFARVARLFAGSMLHVERGEDAVATSWAAVLKNVYAIAFGIADGLGLGDNVRGYLAVAASREMAALIMQFTGRTPAPYQLAGLGDLITTATSAGSHHHDVGLRLARGEGGTLTGEGVHSIATLQRLNILPAGSHPLLELVAELLRSRTAVEQQFLRYLARC